MAFLRQFDGCHAYWRDVGMTGVRLSSGSTVPVEVWAFTDGLIVAARSTLRWVKAPWDWENPTPDAITAAKPKAVRLHRDRVDRLELASRGRRKWIFGWDHALFDLADLSEFDLIVSRRRSDELLALLREIYGSRVKDHRHRR